MSKNNKLILTLIIVLFLIGAAIFTYAFFDSRNNNQTIGQSIRNIFPVSNDSNPNLPPSNSGGDNDPVDGGVIDVVSNQPNKLVQISDEPVSGGTFSSTSTVRYIEKATGNVYEYSYFTKTSQKITNTTIPKIYDSYWVNKDTFIARYLSSDNTTIKSFIGSIVNPGEAGTVSTTFLANNITSITIAGGEIYFIAKSFPGESGFIYNTRNNKTTQIFTTDISELTALWHDNKPFVYTNPSNNVSGTLFKVTNGNLIEVLSNVVGLSASSIGDELLISSFSSRNSTFGYNLSTNELEGYKSILVPEKCTYINNDLYCAVASVQGNFPDNWYIGKSTFNDNFYRIVQDQGRLQIYDFSKDIPNGIDVINISNSPDGEQVLFTNKKDDTLWSLNIE